MRRTPEFEGKTNYLTNIFDENSMEMKEFKPVNVKRSLKKVEP